MAPFRAVTVYRWQVIVAFVAVTASFAAGLVLVTQASHRAQRAATVSRDASGRAVTVARELQRQSMVIDQLRRENTRLLNKYNAKACRARHVLVITLEGILRRGIVQTRRIKIAGLNNRQAIASSERAIRELASSDCHTAPRLKTTPPRLKTP